MRKKENEDVLTTLLAECKEVLVLDLMQYGVNFDDQYQKCLTGHRQGYYLPGAIEPLIDFSGKYYYRNERLIPHPDKPNEVILNQPISDFSLVFSKNQDIVDSDDKLIISAKDLKKFKKYLTEQPTVPVNMIKIAIGIVLIYLSTVCRHKHITPGQYNPLNYLQPQYHYIFHDEFIHDAFEELLDKVRAFVDMDVWYIYFYNVKGTTLILEKTCDYRVYDWHRIQIERKEATDS